MPKDSIPVAELAQLLAYDPESGTLTWKTRQRDPSVSLREHERWNSRHAGSLAGHTNHYGYVVVKIRREAFKAHRVAWALAHGCWPPSDCDLDHINRDKSDNRLTNLRLASRSENLINRPPPDNNTSGVRGVSWYAPSDCWAARIGYQNRKIHLGYFRSLEEASIAYQKAALNLFGEFAEEA